MKIPKPLKSLAGWAIVALVGFFFYRTLSENWSNIESIDLSFDTSAALGVIVFVIAVVVSGGLWGSLLKSVSTDGGISISEAVRVHCVSWLLKYIPGQVSSYVNKILWGERHGFSKKSISTSFVYENVLMVMAGFVLSLPVLIVVAGGQDWTQLVAPLLVIIPMLVVLNRKAFLQLLNTFARIFRKGSFSNDQLLSTSQTATYLMLYMIPRLLNGIGFVLIAGSFLMIDATMYLGLAATYILASIIGLLAIFVPGGLGVREAVIVTFASVYFPVEQAVVLALVARLYATISDIGVALVYAGLNKGRLKLQ